MIDVSNYQQLSLE